MPELTLQDKLRARDGRDFADHANEYQSCPGCATCTYSDRPQRNGTRLGRPPGSKDKTKRRRSGYYKVTIPSVYKWWLLEPLWWRKEARQSWDYIVTDEAAYIAQFRDIESARQKGGYPYLYLKGKIWIEVHFGVNVNGKLNLYLAIIEAVDDATRNSTNRGIDLSSEWNEKLMFISVGEVIQHGQRMLWSQVPVLVRLKFLDDFVSPFGHLPNHAVEDCLTACLPLRKDWENRVTRWVPSGQTSQSPSELVESTSHVIDGIPNNDTPPSGRISHDINPVDVESMFKVFISSKSIGVTVRKGIRFTPEFVQMFVRPTEFEPLVEPLWATTGRASPR